MLMVMVHLKWHLDLRSWPSHCVTAIVTTVLALTLPLVMLRHSLTAYMWLLLSMVLARFELLNGRLATVTEKIGNWRGGGWASHRPREILLLLVAMTVIRQVGAVVLVPSVMVMLVLPRSGGTSLPVLPMIWSMVVGQVVSRLAHIQHMICDNMKFQVFWCSISN